MIGGIAGSVLAGVLTRVGVDALVIERKAAFRDRVRGEGFYPRAAAEVRRLGLDALMARADAVYFWARLHHEDRRPGAGAPAASPSSRSRRRRCGGWS
jgi:flavin-dependent dehydrogenase